MLRSPLVTVFHDTSGFCFESALRDVLGPAVRDSVYGLLERSGIPQREVPSRFDEAVAVLMKLLGEPSRVLVHRTLVGLFGQYSRRVDFSYEDSLRNRLLLLKEEGSSGHLVPKRLYESYGLDEALVPGRC